MIYQNLARALPDGHPMKQASVHFVMAPEHDPKVGLKMPLLSMTVHNKDPGFVADLTRLQAYVEEELNVLTVKYVTEDNPDQISYTATLNFKALGAKLGKSMKAVAEGAKNLTAADFAAFEANGEIEIGGFQ